MARDPKPAAGAGTNPKDANPHQHFNNVEALLEFHEKAWLEMASNPNTPAERVVETLTAIHLLRKEAEEERP